MHCGNIKQSTNQPVNPLNCIAPEAEIAELAKAESTAAKASVIKPCKKLFKIIGRIKANNVSKRVFIAKNIKIRDAINEETPEPNQATAAIIALTIVSIISTPGKLLKLTMLG